MINISSINLGIISQKLLGGKIAPKMVYFVLEKELLDFGKTAPWSI